MRKVEGLHGSGVMKDLREGREKGTTRAVTVKVGS